MLCSLNNRRPDKVLNKILLALAYMLIGLTLSIIFSLLYEERTYITILIIIFLIMSVYLTIRVIKVSEEAITYGGFANEMIRNPNLIERIDNAEGFPVLQNTISELLFKNQNILEFLTNNISNNMNNKSALSRLEQSVSNLVKTKITIALDLNKDSQKVFADEEWFEVEIRPIYLRKENIFEKPFSVEEIVKETYIYWSLNNITAKKTMETIFYEEKNYLHDFLDYLPVGLYTCNSEYKIEYCNHVFSNMLNIPREEIYKKTLSDFFLDDTFLPPKTSSWQGRVMLKNNAGQVINAYISQENFRDKGQIKIRSVVFSHLPNEEKIILDLNKSLDKLSWLFTSSPIATLFINQNFEIVDSNKTAQDFFSINKEDLSSHNISDFIIGEDLDSFKEAIITNKYPKKLDLKLKVGEQEKTVAFYVIKMNEKYSTADKTFGWVVYLSDTTEQKNLELQFAQAQKMQAMGQLAGGIAHDFNNLLTAIIGFSDLLLQRHGVGDPSFSDLMQIKQNSNRAAGLVRQLLAFSRKQALQPKLIDVSENFLELSHMLKRVLGENINIIFHHNDDLGFVKVDPVQFSQVIINLAVNAKDAMNSRGDLNINTSIEHLTEPYSFGEDTIPPGEFVVMKFSDTGYGISKENLARIFEPFFSTKQNVVGSGTGLGLAMVYGIVRQTGGFIKVDSKQNEGTTFSVYIPRFEKEEDDIIEKNNEPTSMNLSQKMILGMNVSKLDRRLEVGDFDASKYKILFVDDEASVRAFAVRALKRKGYNVVDCDSAENAIDRINEAQNYDLMITDMVMPGINGAELAKIVKEKIPDIKIILASGYSEDMARKELPNHADFDFMAKPFSLGDLVDKTFEILIKDK